jgi:hypothetical protein
MAINYALYHPKWRLISSLIRFKRAEGRRERCFCEHGKPHRSSRYKVSLATVHLDHDRTNNRFDNLAAFARDVICGGIISDTCTTADMGVKHSIAMACCFRWKK